MVKVFRAYRVLQKVSRGELDTEGYRCEGAHIRVNSHLCQRLQERA